MTVIVSIMGRKGGITKTTLAKNLAAGAALAGYSTVLIDADSQGNASDGVRVAREDGFKSLILDGAEWNDVLRPIPERFTGKHCDNFWVVPSFDGQLLVEKDDKTPNLIIDRMEELRGSVDLVICDLPPGITNTHIGLYYASDWVILPTLCELDSVLSLDSTINYLTNAAQVGKDAGYEVAKILGIVPNRFNAVQKVHQKNIGFVTGRYYDKYHVFPAIRDLAVWGKATQLRMCIHAMGDGEVYAERMEARKAITEMGPVLQAIFELIEGPGHAEKR